MDVQPLLTGMLLVLGVGFLVANARLVYEYLSYRRRRVGALLVWPGPQAPYYGMGLGMGVVLGLVIFYKIVVSGQSAFGETMMFVYFGYLSPIVRPRIRRGFYEDGIWADSAFIKYDEVGGFKWQEEQHAASLIVISRLRSLARRMAVPLEHYGAARRLLRDKIREHAIQFVGTGLDLGGHDERDQA